MRYVEHIEGMQNVERAIIDGVRASGIPIDAGHFRWCSGKQFVSPPMAFELEVKVRGRSANAVLSRAQVDDSSRSICRLDVVTAIQVMVGTLTR